MLFIKICKHTKRGVCGPVVEWKLAEMLADNHGEFAGDSKGNICKVATLRVGVSAPEISFSVGKELKVHGVMMLSKTCHTGFSISMAPFSEDKFSMHPVGKFQVPVTKRVGGLQLEGRESSNTLRTLRRLGRTRTRSSSWTRAISQSGACCSTAVTIKYTRDEHVNYTL
jgi:hypothetical protein